MCRLDIQNENYWLFCKAAPNAAATTNAAVSSLYVAELTHIAAGMRFLVIRKPACIGPSMKMATHSVP